MQNSNLIATLRVKKGLTQKDMATLLKVSHSVYKLYESNLRIMRLAELNYLSNLFNISLNSLLGISTNPLSFNIKPDIDYKYLKFSLRFVRRRNRITAKDLAKEFHMSAATISRYEHHPEYTSITYLYLFAKKFQVSIDYICGKTLKKEIL